MNTVEKRSYGFLSPQPYMQRAVEDMKTRNRIVVIEPTGWNPGDVAKSLNICRDNQVVAVGGFAQKDAFNHILINEQLGNVVPSRLSFLYCMNKYLMRTLETNPYYFDYIDPMTESNAEAIAKIKEWPFMLKNTSLSLGRGIFKIESAEQLTAILDDFRRNKKLQASIAKDYEYYLQGIDKKALPKVIPAFIAEHYVDMSEAVEYCYEGYVDKEGNIVHYAMTEEVYFSNHQGMGYLTPPLSIDGKMSEKIACWVDDYMGKLVTLGYKNQFFNLEFWIMPDGKIALTEINPRAAHSYHYNYLFSFGNSLYEDNLKLAAGEKLSGKHPWAKWKSGAFERYTLIMLITTNTPGKAGDILDYQYVESMNEESDKLVRYIKQEDDYIEEKDITSAGTQLLQIWITASSTKEIIRLERQIRVRLYKDQQTCFDYPAYWNA